MSERYDFEWLKIHLGTMWNLVQSRASFVAQISTLAATLLVVASFQGVLDLNSFYFKLALTILLILIPLSCVAFLAETDIALKKVLLSIQDVVGEEFDSKKARKGVERWLSPILTVYPYVAVALIALVIVHVSFRIWK